MASAVPLTIELNNYILEDNARLRRDLVRCLRFIRAIPDNQKRSPGDAEVTAWTRELWAIKREVKE